jgi:transglutaminase-like putative cysteine protease
MRLVRPTFRHTCLALVLAVSDAALALSYGSPLAWALLALPAAALVVRVRVAPGIVAPLIWISRIMIAALAVAGTDIGPMAGVGLAFLAGFFLLDPDAFPAGRASLPAILSVLLAAAFDPTAPTVEPLAWGAAAFMLVWLVAGTAGVVRPRRVAAIALFIVPSAAAGKAIARFLPWAQPHVERVTARFIVPPTGETGLSAGAWLGSVEQLTLTKRMVLRLWSERPLSLRTGVYTRFSGRGWSAGTDHRPPIPFARASPSVAAPEDWQRRVPGEWLAVGTSDVEAGGERAHIVVAAPLLNALPAPAAIQAVRSTESNLQLDAFGVVLAPSRIPAVYGFQYAGRAEAPPLDGDPVVSECLTLPPTLDPRVRALAEQLGPPDASVDAKVRRTVADLQSRCRYSLKVGRWKTGDPVSEFLFDKKKGYCEYFATSTVLLLRLQGVPARYVTGFSVRAANRRGDHYVVRGSDAHAWAEALVPGEGWLEVDATPPGDYEAVQQELAMNAGEELIEALRSRWSDFVARLREGGWGLVLSGVASDLSWLWRGPVPWIAAMVVASALVRRRWRRRSASPPAVPSLRAVDPALQSCFERLERLWLQAGHPRPRHRGPLEHTRALPDAHEELRRLSAEVVESFYRSAYGGQPIPPEEAARFAAALDRFADARPPGG